MFLVGGLPWVLPFSLAMVPCVISFSLAGVPFSLAKVPLATRVIPFSLAGDLVRFCVLRDSVSLITGTALCDSVSLVGGVAGIAPCESVFLGGVRRAIPCSA